MNRFFSKYLYPVLDFNFLIVFHFIHFFNHTLAVIHTTIFLFLQLACILNCVQRGQFTTFIFIDNIPSQREQRAISLWDVKLSGKFQF